MSLQILFRFDLNCNTWSRARYSSWRLSYSRKHLDLFSLQLSSLFLMYCLVSSNIFHCRLLKPRIVFFFHLMNDCQILGFGVSGYFMVSCKGLSLKWLIIQFGLSFLGVSNMEKLSFFPRNFLLIFESTSAGGRYFQQLWGPSTWLTEDDSTYGSCSCLRIWV